MRLDLHQFVNELRGKFAKAPTPKQWQGVLAQLQAMADAMRREQFALSSRWRGLVEGAPDIILTLDTAGRIVFSNRPLGGLDRSQVEGRYFGEFVQGWTTAMLEGLLAASGSVEDAIGFEAQTRFQPGAWQWYSLRASGNRNEQGVITSVTMIATDVTQKRALEAQNERFRLLLDRAQDAILVADPNQGGLLIDCNATAVQLCGLGRNRLLTQKLEQIFSSFKGQEWTTWIARLEQQGGTLDLVDQLQRHDGSQLPVNVSASLKVIGGQAYLLLTARDLSARLAMEKELEEQRAKVTYAAKMASLGEMAGGVAHEINNPLTIIKGLAEHIQLLLRTAPKDSDAILDKTTQIKKTIMRIARIVKGLRTFSRDGTNDPCAATSVASLFDDALGLCAEAFRHAEIELIAPAVDPNLSIECRATEISQVLLNLLSNARDAVAGRSPAWVKLEALDLGELVAIAVTDSGPGIPEAAKERIMEPFFTTKGVGKGTGLGLSISRGIAERHHGWLEYDQHHHNTRFILKIPKIQPAVDEPLDDAGSPARAS